MKRVFYVLVLLCSAQIYGQDSIAILDSLSALERSLYIKDYTQQLNIKLEANNDIQKFHIPFEGRNVDIQPNIGLKYALVFSYKFLSIRLGIRPNVSDSSKEDKGESDTFRFRIKLLFDKWTHKLEYNRVKGYYIIDSKTFPEIESADNHLQLPELESKVLYLSSAYKFNDNYSVRAIESQVEQQKLSVGSFVPSLDVWFYKFDGAETLINGSGETVTRDNYMESNGIDIIVNAGYFYTFVYKNWYANLKLIPGIGIDFNTTTSFSDGSSTNSNYQDLVLSIEPGAGIGYNSEKFFFGTSYSKKMTNQSYTEDKVHFNITKNSFFIFFGYRFKAPKSVTRTVDKIEESVPLLKHEN